MPMEKRLFIKKRAKSQMGTCFKENDPIHNSPWLVENSVGHTLTSFKILHT